MWALHPMPQPNPVWQEGLRLYAITQVKTDLNINNVRTTIMGAAADMWWNLNDGRYEIPKNSNKHSMFAGALWIAGIDAGEQLKAAAMTYRQTGNDFGRASRCFR